MRLWRARRTDSIDQGTAEHPRSRLSRRERAYDGLTRPLGEMRRLIVATRGVGFTSMKGTKRDAARGDPPELRSTVPSEQGSPVGPSIAAQSLRMSVPRASALPHATWLIEAWSSVKASGNAGTCVMLAPRRPGRAVSQCNPNAACAVTPPVQAPALGPGERSTVSGVIPNVETRHAVQVLPECINCRRCSSGPRITAPAIA